MKHLGSLIAAAVLASLVFSAPLGAMPLTPQLTLAPDSLVIDVKVKKKVIVYKKPGKKKPAVVVVVPVGPQCVARVEREGSQNVLRSFAEASARNAWQRAVRSIYGERYLNLGIAKNGNLTCVRSTSGILNLTRCTLAADPCKPAGT